MDRDFAGGGYPAGDNTPPSMLGIDEAYLNGYLSGLSFQSILQPTCPYDVGVGGVSPQPAFETPAFSPATYGYFNQESPTTYQFLNPQELKMPKHEDLSTEDFAFQLLKLNETTTNAAVSPPEPLINFFSTTNSTTSISSVDDVISTSGYFVDHLSLEPKKPNIDAAAAAAPQLVCQTGSLNDIMNFVQPADSFPTYRVNSVPSSSSSLSSSRHMPYKKSGLARQRRQRISEKTRCLQRLLPWDKKMDMGTMLEEAYKYIKFLQVQINVLQNMPLKTSPSFGGGGSQYPTTTSSSSGNDVVWGELGKLSRQQLLEVVVNSPVAQTVLYSRGCCVYSMEQLVLLRKFAEKKALLEQVLFASPLLFY